MEEKQVKEILNNDRFPDSGKNKDYIETHISWVILSDHFVFKMKKPLQYDFLDYSSLDKRKGFCEKELALNRRLSEAVYLDVLPIIENEGTVQIAEVADHNVIDYAVKMARLPESRKMDNLLKKDFIDLKDIKNLVQKITHFHQTTSQIKKQENLIDFRERFNEIEQVSDFFNQHLGDIYQEMVQEAVVDSDRYLKEHFEFIRYRQENGFVRDCHGDLHSRNIFLAEEPVIFDCIEFNDALRQIDLIDEIAFFCMDLEFYDKFELSAAFYSTYMQEMSFHPDSEEKQLYTYYKAYRANIRAKVKALKLQNLYHVEMDQKELNEIKTYLHLMKNYLSEL